MMTKDTKVDDGKLSVGGVRMATCEVCGNENDNSFEVHIHRQRHTFDTVESRPRGLRLLAVIVPAALLVME
jgi:hypothetical protein